MWRVIGNYVMSMPDKFVQAKLKYARAVRGLVAYERWSECLETMISPVGFTLGRLYVDANFDESTKTTVRWLNVFPLKKYQILGSHCGISRRILGAHHVTRE